MPVKQTPSVCGLIVPGLYRTLRRVSSRNHDPRLDKRMSSKGFVDWIVQDIAARLKPQPRPNGLLQLASNINDPFPHLYCPEGQVTPIILAIHVQQVVTDVRGIVMNS